MLVAQKLYRFKYRVISNISSHRNDLLLMVKQDDITPTGNKISEHSKYLSVTSGHRVIKQLKLGTISVHQMEQQDTSAKTRNVHWVFRSVHEGVAF